MREYFAAESVEHLIIRCYTPCRPQPHNELILFTTPAGQTATLQDSMKTEKGTGAGAGNRDDLERLTWKAVQAAVDHSRTEDTGQGYRSNLLALHVANALAAQSSSF